MPAHFSTNTLMRYFFPVLFFVPLNFFMMVGGIGYGIQWAFFRYQVTSFGDSIIPGARSLNYVLSGLVTDKSGVAEILLILSAVILFAAFLFAMANRTKISGILTAFSGIAALAASIIQYGITFHGATGVCIPFGSIILVVFGLLLYLSVPDPDGTNILVKYDYLFLLMGVFLIYSSWATPNYTNDTLAPQVLPYSILENHTVYLDRYQNDISSAYGFRYYKTDSGHYASIFPIVLPVLITPLYIVPVLMKIPLNGMVQLAMTHISAALVSALAVMVVYLACRYVSNRKVALFTALVFAFATSTWSISSQLLYAHGMSELLLALMILLVFRNEVQATVGNSILLGICSGLFVFNRPSDSLLVLPVIAYIVWYHRERIWYYAAAGIFAGLPFLLYNVISFHAILGGYAGSTTRLMLSASTFSNYLGLLIAPNKGLFVFTPVLVLALVGFLWMKDNRKPVCRFFQWSVIAMACTILVYASFDDWGGGETYGPRYLTCLLPYLAIGLCIFFNNFDRIPHRKIVAVTATLLIIVSIFIQGIGVFYFPDLHSPRQDWDTYWNSYNLWDYNDSVIINSLFHHTARPALRIDNETWLKDRFKDDCTTPSTLQRFKNDPAGYAQLCGMIYPGS